MPRLYALVLGLVLVGCSKGTATVSRNIIIIDTGASPVDGSDSPDDGPMDDTGFTPLDSGDGDTAGPDTGSGDTAETDTGEDDTGVSDTGVSDTGVSDTGTSDTGFEDSDTSTPDTASLDGGSIDGVDTAVTTDSGFEEIDTGIDPDGGVDVDGAPDSGDSPISEDGPTPGSIFVTEIMANPDVVSDLAGEWFELYNPRGRSFSLLGCRFVSLDGDEFSIDTPLEIGPWSRVVFGVNADPDENGGAEVNFEYDRLDFSLDNFEDRIRLINAEGVVVSTVDYNAAWDRDVGRSMQLDRAAHYTAAISSASNWCSSTTEMDAGDFGTPHTPNEYCSTIDHDDDGYIAAEGDCDDMDAMVYPGAVERWDGMDNDCDGVIDDFSEAGATTHLEGRSTDYLGWYSSLSTGDVTGDGQPDLLVGGSWVLTGGDGGIWVADGEYHLAWSGHIEDWGTATIEGGNDSSYFATMGPRMGDINDDGVDDVLVLGTDAYSSSEAFGVYAGSLFYGGSDLTGSYVESEADVLFSSSMAGYWYVSALSDVDFDLDGHDDVFIGNYFASTLSRGDVFLFSGAGLGEGTVYDLSDGSDVHLQGNSNGDFFGYSLGAGDVTSDGNVEIFSAAAAENYGGVERAGCVYMISSGDLDVSSGSTREVSDVSTFKMCAVDPHARLGRNAAPQLFDVDGDAMLDIVLGAPGSEYGATEDEGKVYVFLNDGDWSGVRTVAEADVTLTSGGADYFGNALHHGDFDGDGESELVVGAPESDNYEDTLEHAGEVYIYRASDLAVGGTIGPESASLKIDGSGFTGFGSAIRSADFDGNGVDELIVASHRWNEAMGRISIFALD